MTSQFEALATLENELDHYIHGRSLQAKAALDLDRMQAMLRSAGSPHKLLRVVHVAGTSGKGSTCSTIASILSRHGLRTGLHLSPFLQLLTETWQIDGRPVDPRLALEVFYELKPTIDKTAAPFPLGMPTYFEWKVLLALCIFARMEVDAAVIETGVGGRLDATNVVDPAVAVLTGVGLDHMHLLGETVEAIATEKMQIIKPSVVAVSGASQPSVRRLIRHHAELVGATLWEVGREIICSTTSGSMGVQTPRFQFTSMTPSLRGGFQGHNLCLALGACDAFGIDLAEDKVREAVAVVKLPGRLEIVQDSPTVVLDGAHNGDKLAGTLEWIDREYPDKRRVVVAAFKETKDTRALLELLRESTDLLILTTFGRIGTWYADDPEKLRVSMEEMGYQGALLVEQDPEAAVDLALHEASGFDVVLVTGSLYLAGRARERWHSRTELLSHPELAGAYDPG